MENYRKSSHCIYDIKYHLVWITKYRKPVITGQIAIRTREIVRMICQSNEVKILAGHVGSDHIHLLVSVSPHLSASKLVRYIKGNTLRKIQMEYKELNKQFGGQHLWARVILITLRFFSNISFPYPAKSCYNQYHGKFEENNQQLHRKQRNNPSHDSKQSA